VMRFLLDEAGLKWVPAWEITRAVCAYTNHTLLPEALETWPVQVMEPLIPRHVQIIYEINRRFLDEVRERFPGDGARISRMSLIDEAGDKKVRMAHLATVGSHTVNGVAALHTELLKSTVLHDFDEANGARPAGALLLGSDGRLYGTTTGGGTNDAGAVLGLGVIFSIARDGTGYEVLHVFDSTQGANPAGALLQLSDAVFVGTTENGANCGQGTLYRLSLAGDTVDGITNCGRKKNNNSGGGSTAPALLLLLGMLGLRRLRS